MSVAAATMAMSAGAAARTDRHLFVTRALLDPVVSRAASFLAERVRTRFFAFFTLTDIFLNETRRSDRSMLSRYRIERVGGCAFITRTILLPNGLPRVVEPSTQQRCCPATGG
jgi:hypothetical protein